MSYIKSYKELIVWQKAMELGREIFRLTAKFPKSELYGLVSQIRRASVAIPSNIAEGYGRGTRKEYRQFCLIAYGSGLELETQLLLSKDLSLAPSADFRRPEEILTEVLKMLNSIIKKLGLVATRP